MADNNPHFLSLTPNLMVKNVNNTVEFYRNILGFNLLASVPEKGDYNWALIGRDDIVLMLENETSLKAEYSQLSTQNNPTSFTLFIKVNQIASLYKDLQNKAPVVKKLHTTFYNMQEFAIEDCNGVILVFAEPVEHK